MTAELIGVFVTSFVVGLSGALMPGPLVTLAVAESARSGFRRGPQVVIGHAVVELAAVVGLLFGVSQIVQSDLATGLIGVLGGLVLLWMGYTMGKSAWRGDVALTAEELVTTDSTESASRARSILASPIVRGGAVSIFNPYWLIWWATVGAAYVTRSLTLGIAGLVAFYVGHIMADLGWISLLSAVVSSGRQALSNRVYRGIILFCAAVMVALGVYFLISGITPLTRL